MIESVYKKIHNSGIIHILINTSEKWVDFLINRVCEEHKVEISFYQYDELICDEYIEMNDDFVPFQYMIYSHQEKDQISLVLIPRSILINNKEWKKLCSYNNSLREAARIKAEDLQQKKIEA